MMGEDVKTVLEVDQLIFEVTRKCNMKCDHCLRGESQDCEMSNEVVDRVLENITSIGELVITGGEPSLNVEAIKYIVSKIIEKDIGCDRFFIVTNGLVYSEQLVVVLLELYAYCIEGNGGYESEFSGGLAISVDKYHSGISRNNYFRYKGLSFYSTDKEPSENYGKNIIDEGMAKVNQLNGDYHSPQMLAISIGHDDRLNVEDLYINARGDVLGDCDMSYTTQEKYKVGNVLSKSLVDILLSAFSANEDAFIAKELLAVDHDDRGIAI